MASKTKTETKTETVYTCDDCNSELTKYTHVCVVATIQEESCHNGAPYDTMARLADLCISCWSSWYHGAKVRFVGRL